MKKILLIIGSIVVIALAALVALSFRSAPKSIVYGMTFSIPYAEEIGIDWKAAYRAMLGDLGVRHLRIPAYWPMVEPRQGAYDWRDLDYEIAQASRFGADVVLGVGKRLPRWPECHIPSWAPALSKEEQQSAILAYIEATVERYKGDKTIVMWQVENEPYLGVFAADECGPLDETFLQKEIDLVHSLDPRPILLTDSGNLGTWFGAYQRSDVFGTSVYLYFWNERLGAFRTILPPSYYRIKENLMRIAFGSRPIILSELSLEPWLAASINDVPLEEQLARMNSKKFDEILQYAKGTGLGTQYLWGVEWWYYMRTKQAHPEFWDAARALFVR